MIYRISRIPLSLLAVTILFLPAAIIQHDLHSPRPRLFCRNQLKYRISI